MTDLWKANWRLMKLTSHLREVKYIGVYLRMHPEIKATAQDQAKASGLNFSEWIRKAMVEKIERERK